MPLIAEKYNNFDVTMYRIIETETFTVAEYDSKLVSFATIARRLNKAFGWEKSELREALKNIKSV